MKKKLFIFIGAIIIIGFCSAGMHAAQNSKPAAYGMFYKANELFKDKQYDKAIEQYKQVLALGVESGNLYYNMGNAYFKSGFLGEALGNYEKAKRLIPNDSDLKANIRFIESLRENPILANKPGWIFAIPEYLAGYFSLDRLTIIWLVVYWLLTIFYITAILFQRKRYILKQYTFIGVCMVLFISSILAVKFKEVKVDVYAFVIENAVDSKFAPASEATTYFRIYEGTKVKVVREEDQWTRIKTPDGKVGWILQSALYKI